MEKEKAISVKNLVKKFGDFVANDNLTFDVYKGEIFGFLGANGAGKTTTLKILCGLSKPTSGQINVAGFNVYTETNKIKNNIGYMEPKIFALRGLNGLRKHSLLWWNLWFKIKGY